MHIFLYFDCFYYYAGRHPDDEGDENHFETRCGALLFRFPQLAVCPVRLIELPFQRDDALRVAFGYQ